MWLTTNLISECTPNSNFSANQEDNENDQDNDNHPNNEKEGNKYMFKVNNGKKLWCLYDKLWTACESFKQQLLFKEFFSEI